MTQKSPWTQAALTLQVPVTQKDNISTTPSLLHDHQEPNRASWQLNPSPFPWEGETRMQLAFQWGLNPIPALRRNNKGHLIPSVNYSSRPCRQPQIPRLQHRD